MFACRSPIWCPGKLSSFIMITNINQLLVACRSRHTFGWSRSTNCSDYRLRLRLQAHLMMMIKLLLCEIFSSYSDHHHHHHRQEEEKKEWGRDTQRENRQILMSKRGRERPFFLSFVAKWTWPLLSSIRNLDLKKIDLERRVEQNDRYPVRKLLLTIKANMQRISNKNTFDFHPIVLCFWGTLLFLSRRHDLVNARFSFR